MAEYPDMPHDDEGTLSCTQLAPEWQEIYERKVLEMIGRLGSSPN